MNCNILIVDDDKSFLELLSRFFKNKNFIVYSAENVKEALKIISTKKVDMILSDVEMPGINGYEFLKELRQSGKYHDIPFVLMSGKKITEIDLLEGYEKGTDDYLIKPFSFHVMFAKIKTILKNKKLCAEIRPIKISNLEIHEESKKVVCSKKEIKLTRKEYELLLVLSKNKNKVFSQEQLLNLVWDKNYSDPHTVETHISSLRKKLKCISKKIKTVSGYGYKLED
ncbi:MAG TPA: response regulator transcription factor [Elusimicrobiales bacterium]|jgi:two-component system alkaline phosphatase synthesis response regulator PhoP|nr:response regulator transcription factor [Elusimicrobiales bacterium]HPO96236.1 response regulator transcription factor [Elusimicrobiales bacterium]